VGKALIIRGARQVGKTTLRDPAHLDPPLPLQPAEQRLHLVAAEAGEDLLQFTGRRAGCGGILGVPQPARVPKRTHRAMFAP
jgi:hypothetical protein